MSARSIALDGYDDGQPDGPYAATLPAYDGDGFISWMVRWEADGYAHVMFWYDADAAIRAEIIKEIRHQMGTYPDQCWERVRKALPVIGYDMASSYTTHIPTDQWNQIRAEIAERMK